jgi:SAM-dependent methyltransferase
LYLWNDETIAWLDAAARYTKFYKILARRVREVLPVSPVLLEPGCGPGFFTRELAEFAGHITAVDNDERAAAELRHLGLKNVTVICADAFGLRYDRCYDAAVYCYYGGENEIIDAALGGKCGKVIAIGSVTDKHNFSLEGIRKRCFISLLDSLDRRGIKYSLEKLDLDFSQPVRSFDEAVRFLTHYSRAERAPEKEEVEKRLKPLNDDHYPLCIPAHRNVGIAVIGGKD